MKLHVLKIIFYFSFFLFSHCYYNPVMNSLLNPAETEENNAFLGLLGLSGQPLLITGQIRYANGVAEVGLVLVPGKEFAPQSKSTSSGFVTDAGGRFYIPYQTGDLPFIVYKNGSNLFEITFKVASPTDITYSAYGGGPSLEITGLGTVNPSGVGNFFELVRAYFNPGSEISLHQTNFGSTPITIYLEFNEPPASIEVDATTWNQTHVIFSPAPSSNYYDIAVSGNQIIMEGAEGFTPNTQHTIDFTSNIKSASGKSLTPARYSFYFSL
ncbi:hypothetical protein EHQ59_10930 [Leptospira kemamanensis]|uniref:SbsA Ig-like domain-containing protein n=1 Tax=Leptospira kemamanensis TaxID=2484942 RepID=A0A4R9JPJ5_9LEPT|nr:Ig-like domain-containing protein [Leptospira kemamanensis]TGL51406.1 hypothetical protein EHQ59_10930 [Leptospira kemamanensis]